MSIQPTYEVVDIPSGTAMYYGTWHQVVQYVVREKLGTMQKNNWLGHDLKLAPGVDVRRIE